MGTKQPIFLTRFASSVKPHPCACDLDRPIFLLIVICHLDPQGKRVTNPYKFSTLSILIILTSRV